MTGAKSIVHQRRQSVNRKSSLWSVSLGRPGGIKHGDSVCPPISPLHSSPDMAQLAAWAELCTIQARVTDIHNGPQSKSNAPDQVFQQLSALNAELTSWLEELPDHLRCVPDTNASTPGPAYALQLASLATTIVLHRPMAGFENSRGSQTVISNSRARTTHDASISRQICRSSALEIGSLLRHYISRFLPNQIPTIFTRMSFIASTTLIFGILITDPSSRGQTGEDRACLKTCLEVMGLMEARFPSAGHTRSVLLKILRNNHIALDDGAVEESPRSLDGEGENAWRNLMDMPAFPLPSDLDWLYPNTNQGQEFLLLDGGGAGMDLGMGLHDFGTTYGGFATSAQGMDLAGLAQHTGEEQQPPPAVTPAWPQNTT